MSNKTVVHGNGKGRGRTFARLWTGEATTSMVPRSQGGRPCHRGKTGSPFFAGAGHQGSGVLRDSLLPPANHPTDCPVDILRSASSVPNRVPSIFLLLPYLLCTFIVPLNDVLQCPDSGRTRPTGSSRQGLNQSRMVSLRRRLNMATECPANRGRLVFGVDTANRLCHRNSCQLPLTVSGKTRPDQRVGTSR
jgi:hypothetical protein